MHTRKVSALPAVPTHGHINFISTVQERLDEVVKAFPTMLKRLPSFGLLLLRTIHHYFKPLPSHWSMFWEWRQQKNRPLSMEQYDFAVDHREKSCQTDDGEGEPPNIHQGSSPHAEGFRWLPSAICEKEKGEIATKQSLSHFTNMFFD